MKVQDQPLAEELTGGGVDVDSLFGKYGELHIYFCEEFKENEFLLEGYEKNSNNERFGSSLLQITGIEDFNRYLAIQGKEELTHRENEFALAYNVEEYGDIYDYYEENYRSPLVLNGYELQMIPGALSGNLFFNNGRRGACSSAVIPVGRQSEAVSDFKKAGDKRRNDVKGG